MDEFSLIRRHFAAWASKSASDDVSLGIGDDCALLRPRADHELAVTTDTLVAGRHFPVDTAPYDIGWKSLAVSLSDLAAMGAAPGWFLLALTVPEANDRWLAEFAAGLRSLAEQSGIVLVGGDTTRGALSITITAAGAVPTGSSIRRDGAQVGDWVCVTGTLGDAALALRKRLDRTLDDQPNDRWLRARLDRPLPRVTAGLAFRGLASAGIDLSDGLAGDLMHILAASHVGASVDADRLPMSESFQRSCGTHSRLALQAAGGDDYELCVCIPQDRLAEARARVDIPLTVIGRIEAEPGLRWRDGNGAIVTPDLQAYQHFAGVAT